MNAGVVAVVVSAHPPVPSVVEGREANCHDGEDEQPDQDEDVLLQGSGCSCFGRDIGEPQREDPTDRVVDWETVEHPIALLVPPDVLSAELREPVVRVQDEPEVIPENRQGEVPRQDDELGADSPTHTLEKTDVNGDQGEEEHEQVVAGERLTTHEKTVEPASDPSSPVPGGHLLRPTILTFGFDFDGREQNGEQEPIQNGANHGTSFVSLNRNGPVAVTRRRQGYSLSSIVESSQGTRTISLGTCTPRGVRAISSRIHRNSGKGSMETMRQVNSLKESRHGIGIASPPIDCRFLSISWVPPLMAQVLYHHWPEPESPNRCPAPKA